MANRTIELTPERVDLIKDASRRLEVSGWVGTASGLRSLLEPTPEERDAACKAEKFRTGLPMDTLTMLYELRSKEADQLRRILSRLGVEVESE